MEKVENIIGDVPFTDCDGNTIFIGSEIEQQNFNGEQYTAKYKVVVDPSDNEVCLQMIIGNAKAMSIPGFRSFGTVINGWLRKGRIVKSA